MPERLSNSLADDLLARISRREYKAGDRLPSEQDLMTAYGVGRNTVREAMQSLRTLGLVEIRPRLGAKVLDAGPQNAFSSPAVSALLRDETVRDLYDVPSILEPAAAAKAAANRTDEDIVALRRARTHFRVAYEMEALVWEADIEFHHAVAVASGNRVLVRILAPMSGLLRHARMATNTLPAAVEFALRQHEEIGIAIEEGSSPRARRAMTEHMQSAVWAINQIGDISAAAGSIAADGDPGVYA